MYKYLKYVFYCFVFICIIFIVLILSINSLLNSNKDNILNQLAPYHEGQLDFERVSLDIVENFPSINIKLSEVIVVDSLYDDHQQILFQASAIKGAVSIRKLLKNEVEFKFFTAENGQFNYITDENGYNNLYSFIGNKLLENDTSSSNFTINYDDLDIELRNFELNLINEKSRQSFSGILHTFITNDEAGQLLLKQIAVKDSLFEQHKQYLISSEEMSCSFSAIDLKNKKALLKTINFKNGEANFVSIGDYRNVNNVFASLQSKRPKTESNSPDNFLQDVVQLGLQNFDLQISNKSIKQDIRFQIQDLKSDLSLKNKRLHSSTSIETLVKGLGFNLEKGSFLTNAQVSSDIDFTFNLEQQKISIQPCVLNINNQLFDFKGDIDASGKKTRFLFKLENEKTDFEAVSNILTTRLRDTLSQFKFNRPIKTDILLKGSFDKEDLVWIKVDFDINDNTFQWKEYGLTGMSTKGYFLNRLFEEADIDKEKPRNYQVVFEEIKGNYEKINFTAKDVHYEHNPDSLLFIKFGINAQGKPESLSKLLGNEQFLFAKGDFNMDLTFTGNMESINDLIEVSDAQLEFNDFEVAYTPAEVTFPIRYLSVDKTASDAQFQIESFTLNKEHEFTVEGSLDNFTALVLNNVEGNPKSDATFHSESISWDDFMDIFGEDGLLKSEEEHQKTIEEQKENMVKLKKVIAGFHESFQPNISIKVDTFNYKETLNIQDFKAEASYIDATHLLLDEIKFNYEEGNVDISGIFGVGDPETTSLNLNFKSENVNLQKLLPAFDYFDTPFLKNLSSLPKNVALDFKHKGTYKDFAGLVPNTSVGKVIFSIDQDVKGTITYQPDQQMTSEEVSEFFAKTTMEIEGNPEVMNDWFGNEEFFFRKGIFKVKSAYTGDLTTIDKLLSKSSTQLTIQNSEVFYKPVGIAFPITDLNLDVKNDTAYFDLFMYLLGIDEELNFEGSLRNFTSLLYPDERSVSTDVLISSPHLQWNNFIDLFSSDSDIFKSTGTSFNNASGFKETVKGLSNNFNPSVKVQIDTAVYNEKLTIHNFITGLYFTKKEDLILDKTSFDYEQGNAELGIRFNLSNAQTTPFSTSFKADKIDFAKILKSFDYFNINMLKDLEEMTGKVDLDVIWEGVLQDTSGLIVEENRGVVTFNLEDVRIAGFNTDNILPKRLFKESRIKDVYFAPICNTIFIKGSNIEIPQMEIQSTAFDVFVGGDFHYNNISNIWISIPLSNIRAQTDSLELLKKHNYAETGKKIHVEGFIDKKGKSKFKLRLNRKRFYKIRGIKDQYKIDQKKNREDYRKWKKSQ